MLTFSAKTPNAPADSKVHNLKERNVWYDHSKPTGRKNQKAAIARFYDYVLPTMERYSRICGDSFALFHASEIDDTKITVFPQDDMYKPRLNKDAKKLIQKNLETALVYNPANCLR